MTKNVGSMTRGQAHEICNQIENTCKKHGVNPKEIISNLIRENFFSDKIGEYISGKQKEVKKSFISLSPIVSDGRTGKEFLSDLQKANLSVGTNAESILKTTDFTNLVTKGVTYHIGIIKGEEFSDSERTTANIRVYAAKLGGIAPPAEISPLLRLRISDKDIKAFGVDWIIPMHEPIKDSDGNPRLLGLNADDFNYQLYAYHGFESIKWYRETAFLFLFPVSTQVLEA